MNSDAALPAISIVTATLNQADYIEATLKSLEGQNYPYLDYILLDGNSIDGTLAIIEKYKAICSKIIIREDLGQYHALNEGFKFARGEVMGWINSDDLYLPGTLHLVGEIFATFPEIQWLTTRYPIAIDARGRQIKVTNTYGYTRDGFLKGENLPFAGWPATAFIQQESTFWRRSLWDKAGGALDTRFSLAADFELWSRFFQHADLCTIDVPLGCFRRHDAQRTFSTLAQYVEEAKVVLQAVGGNPRTGLLRKLQIWVRSAAPKKAVEGLFRLGLVKPAPSVTHDWSTGRWVRDRF